YQKLRDIFPQKESREPYKRILLVKFWGIGNIVRLSPTLKAIRARFPEAKITFITLNRNRGIYEDCGLYDEALYLKLDSIRAFLWDIIKKFFILRAKKFDLVIDLEPLANFAEIVTFYVGVGARVGFNMTGRRSLFTIKAPFREDEHISKSFFRILSPFGVIISDELLPLPIPLEDKDRQYTERLLSDESIDAKSLIVGMNVNASNVADARRWPPEKFAQLADRIAEELKAQLIYIGAPDERERVQNVIDNTSNGGVNIAGRTSLKQTIAAMEMMNIFITNDSGPMHLAMAMGIPTVAIFGPESPVRYGPISDKHIAIFKNYDCSPCIFFVQAKKIKCRQDAKCIRDITVDEVFEGVKTLYQRWLKEKS
nr:glycosyltransferase family 9 protein [FCB group bacterium]